MSPRTLWIIILKTFGIYLISQIYYPLTELVTYIFVLINHQPAESFEMVDNAKALGFVSFSFSIYLFLILALLFRTDRLINILKLDKSISEEKLELNIHRSSVISIVVLLTGVVLFVDSLPQLLRELYNYYGDTNSYLHFKDYPRAGFIIIRVATVFISIFMLSCSRLIVNFIELKRKGKVIITPPEVENS